jgi:hypothetical protein
MQAMTSQLNDMKTVRASDLEAAVQGKTACWLYHATFGESVY